jgi:UDP-N-acetylglucosamine 2-epimerase (non-hydrolysing)
MQSSENLSQAFKDTSNLELIEPLDYCNFLKMMATSRLVITDSGGIQEETTYLKIPCLTIRPNTERPITVEIGSNTLSSFEDVPSYISMIYKDEYKACTLPPKWDGAASTRIAEKLLSFMEKV